MIRALLALGKIALLVAAIVFLVRLTAGGHVEVLWRGYLIETTPGFVVLVLALLLLVVWQAALLMQFLLGLPQRWRRWRQEITREDAYRALTQGLLAVAAGDVARAERLAARAARVLPDQPLTRLVMAQTARMRGDLPAARRAFAALADDPEGAFFGVRGLLQDSLEQRDYTAARRYLQQADALQPKRPWILRSLFDMDVKCRDWLAAEKTLKRLQRLKALDDASIKEARQVIWLAQAQAAQTAPQVPLATRRRERARFAQAAFRLNPDFLPAALILTDALIAQGKTGAAKRHIRKAWARDPHPQLMARWQGLLPPLRATAASPFAAAEALADWTARLTDLRPEHLESQKAQGQALLAARRWRQARPLLEAASAYRDLAALEEAETGDAAAARRWLELAADAPTPATWVCRSCGHREESWQPICGQCDEFAPFEWRHPEMQQGHIWASRRVAARGAEESAIDILLPPVVS